MSILPPLGPFFVSSSLASSGHFNVPTFVTVSGSRVWVTNEGNHTITELNASNASEVRVINVKSKGFSGLGPVVVSGTHIWVANGNRNAVDEFNSSDGSQIRVEKKGSDHFVEPGDIAVGGNHLWILNGGSVGNEGVVRGSLTEINASDGSLVRVVKIQNGDFFLPSNIAMSGTHLWITNGGDNSNSVIELNATNGSLVRVVRDPVDRFAEPHGIAVNGTHVWVANGGGNSVVELNTSNGSLVRIINAKADGLDGPIGIAVNGGHVWVTNYIEASREKALNYSSITELNESNGSLVRVIKLKTRGTYGPIGVAISGKNLWVANSGDNSILEFDTLNGSMERIVR